jgi:hypothetical protein
MNKKTRGLQRREKLFFLFIATLGVWLIASVSTFSELIQHKGERSVDPLIPRIVPFDLSPVQKKQEATSLSLLEDDVKDSSLFINNVTGER